jgi:hypothetical protein
MESCQVQTWQHRFSSNTTQVEKTGKGTDEEDVNSGLK